MNFEPKYKWFKISDFEFFFQNIILVIQLFYIRLLVPVDMINIFF